MAYAGLVERAKSHFENCNNGPEETPVQGDCSFILTPRATGAGHPSPAGPECKKAIKQICLCMSFVIGKHMLFANICPLHLIWNKLPVVLWMGCLPVWYSVMRTDLIYSISNAFIFICIVYIYRNPVWLFTYKHIHCFIFIVYDISRVLLFITIRSADHFQHSPFVLMIVFIILSY